MKVLILAAVTFPSVRMCKYIQINLASHFPCLTSDLVLIDEPKNALQELHTLLARDKSYWSQVGALIYDGILKVGSYLEKSLGLPALRTYTSRTSDPLAIHWTYFGPRGLGHIPSSIRMGKKDSIYVRMHTETSKVELTLLYTYLMTAYPDKILHLWMSSDLVLLFLPQVVKHTTWHWDKVDWSRAQLLIMGDDTNENIYTQALAHQCRLLVLGTSSLLKDYNLGVVEPLWHQTLPELVTRALTFPLPRPSLHLKDVISELLPYSTFPKNGLIHLHTTDIPDNMDLKNVVLWDKNDRLISLLEIPAVRAKWLDQLCVEHKQ